MSKTLTQAFFETVERSGATAALRYKQDGVWKTITYREFGERARAFACGLIELGVSEGDRVVVLSENRPEWVIADQGVLMSGAAVVPIYPTLTGPQSQYIVNDAGAKIAIVSSEAHLRKLQSVRAGMPQLTHIIVIDELSRPEPDAGVIAFADVVQLGRNCQDAHGEALERRIAGLTPDSLASIVYTSGTTGEPKGAMLTHGNFGSNAEAVVPMIGLSDRDCSLSFLPLSHVFERIAYYAFVLGGATICFAESIDAVPQNLLEIKPTFLVSVPRLFEKIRARVYDKVAVDPPVRQKMFQWAISVATELRAAKEQGRGVDFALALKHTVADRLVFSKVRERTGGNLRYCISGGAPLPVEVAYFFNAIGISILEGYGLTETSPVIAVNRPGDLRPGTVGKPLPGVEVKLGEDNELLVRGPNVMRGYWNNPEATAQAIDIEGWFHTGDIAQFDEAGRVRIVDRKKEIIVMSNGKNVAPQPIENALKASRFVEQVMLVGDRRNYITALIVPNYEVLKAYAAEQRLGELSREELLAHAKVQKLFQIEIEGACGGFAKFEKVKRFTLLAREFDPDRNEMTPTLKVKRRVISENFAGEIEAMYAGEAVSA